MVKCGNEGCKRQLNEGCKRQLFQWSKDEHQSECPHTKTPCPCCGEEITIKSMNKHFKTGCKILWVEHGGKEGDSCSAGLQGHFRLNRDGYKFDVQDIRKSFVVICRPKSSHIVVYTSRSEWDKLVNKTKYYIQTPSRNGAGISLVI
jgi:hypothetical protein